MARVSVWLKIYTTMVVDDRLAPRCRPFTPGLDDAFDGVARHTAAVFGCAGGETDLLAV